MCRLVCSGSVPVQLRFGAGSVFGSDPASVRIHFGSSSAPVLLTPFSFDVLRFVRFVSCGATLCKHGGSFFVLVFAFPLLLWRLSPGYIRRALAVLLQREQWRLFSVFLCT